MFNMVRIQIKIVIFAHGISISRQERIKKYIFFLNFFKGDTILI